MDITMTKDEHKARDSEIIQIDIVVYGQQMTMMFADSQVRSW
jgi:hypothetical protein